MLYLIIIIYYYINIYVSIYIYIYILYYYITIILLYICIYIITYYHYYFCYYFSFTTAFYLLIVFVILFFVFRGFFVFLILLFSFSFWLNNSFSHMKRLSLVDSIVFFFVCLTVCFFACRFYFLSWNCRVIIDNLVTFLQFPKGLQFYSFIFILT